MSIILKMLQDPTLENFRYINEAVLCRPIKEWLGLEFTSRCFIVIFTVRNVGLQKSGSALVQSLCVSSLLYVYFHFQQYQSKHLKGHAWEAIMSIVWHADTALIRPGSWRYVCTWHIYFVLSAEKALLVSGLQKISLEQQQTETSLTSRLCSPKSPSTKGRHDGARKRHWYWNWRRKMHSQALPFPFLSQQTQEVKRQNTSRFFTTHCKLYLCISITPCTARLKPLLALFQFPITLPTAFNLSAPCYTDPVKSSQVTAEIILCLLPQQRS